MTTDSHRPWPVPQNPWLMKQRWENVLFLHYPLMAESIKPFIPSSLELDTYEDTAWISIVAYWTSGLRLRLTPPVPFLSQFPGLNVRTYVKAGGKPGVYFFSLDAHTRPGVFFGSAIYKLPYYYAKMTMAEDAGVIHFESRRDGYVFGADYSPTSPPYQAHKGSLDYWLIERYCLYTERRGDIYISEINHKPWNLHNVSYAIDKNTMLHEPKLDLFNPASAHYSKSIDVHIWPIQKV